jgi:Mouse development and cellular proliferation protein Cullin-7
VTHLSFTRAEAQAKVGKRVRTRVAFAEVPQGAIGTIIRIDRVIDGHDVEVAWLWSGRRTPWVDWLTREEYEARLTELE